MVAKWKQYSQEEIESFYNQATSIKNFFQLMGYKGDLSSNTLTGFREKYPNLKLEDIRKKATDLTGKQFGKLTVLCRDKNAKEKEQKTHQIFFLCKCECGTIKSISKGNLLRGQKSCGCSKVEDAANSHRIDMIGKQYGTLTVISLNEKETKRVGKTCYNCKCSKCGEIRIVRATNLRTGNTQGCLCERMSHGERQIANILKSLSINFITQKTFVDMKNEINNSSLKMDFYLPDYKCCIEYNGIQHYEPIDYFGGKEEFKNRLQLDSLKREYCKQNNIKLIEIPYTDYDEINEGYILRKLERSNCYGSKQDF